jgi:hemolysin III
MTKKEKAVKYYSPREEAINVYSHVVGLFLSVLALVVLIMKAMQYEGVLHLLSFGVFGVSLILLYSASSIYHSATIPDRRQYLRIFDHAAIYVLIAGTYTPFTLIALQGTLGWVFFFISWGMALGGVILKLFFTGRYNLLSTIMYVVMGWIVIFAVKPLIECMSTEGLIWLSIGGLAYTLGAVLYSIKRIPFNHAIFHLFVLVGSFSHFVAVYWFL